MVLLVVLGGVIRICEMLVVLVVFWKGVVLWIGMLVIKIELMFVFCVLL